MGEFSSISIILPYMEMHCLYRIYFIYDRLKESINEYANDYDWKLPAGFSSRFPEGIKLSQCAAAWAVLALQEHRISTPQIPNASV